MYGPNLNNLISIIVSMQEACYIGAKALIAASEAESGQRPKMISHWHEWGGNSTNSGGAGDSSHSHGIPTTNTSEERTGGPGNKIWEEASPCPVGNFMPAITAAYNKVAGEIPRVKFIESKLYVSVGNMHNPAGSPYNEVYKIQSTYTDMLAYANSHSQLNYIGEKVTMWFYLQMMISRLTDAKMVLIAYFDNIQRGYDSYYNGGKPSI